MTRVQRNVLRKKRTLEHAEPIGNEIQVTCVASKRAARALLRGLFSSVLRASVVWALAPVALVMCTVKAETLPPQPQVEVVAVEPMSSRPILPETPIGEVSLGAKLRVIATPGEFEPASFVIDRLRAFQRTSGEMPPFARRLQKLLRGVRRTFGRGDWCIEWADDGEICWLVQVQ